MKKYSSHMPHPVVLVTVATSEKTNVLTIAWASSVSHDPPILMVSVAPKRFSHDLILEAGEFGVTVLADDQKELSTLAGTLTGRKEDKLARDEFKTIPGDMIRAPHIAGAHAWFECKLLNHETVGDHTAFYGEVLKTVVDESRKPLVLFNRIYYGLGDVQGKYP